MNDSCRQLFTPSRLLAIFSFDHLRSILSRSTEVDRRYLIFHISINIYIWSQQYYLSLSVSLKVTHFFRIFCSKYSSTVFQSIDQKIIRPSLSPWSSPLWIVPKKLDSSGIQKWRIVIDYRKLNEKTVGEVFPLPNIDEINTRSIVFFRMTMKCIPLLIVIFSTAF